MQEKPCRHVKIPAHENCCSFFAVETWGRFTDVKWSRSADFTKTSQSHGDGELGLGPEWRRGD